LGPRSITTLWILHPMKIICFIFLKPSHCLSFITGESQHLLDESIHSVGRERGPKMGHPGCHILYLTYFLYFCKNKKIYKVLHLFLPYGKWCLITFPKNCSNNNRYNVWIRMNSDKSTVIVPET
jgi:hypothetical protein